MEPLTNEAALEERLSRPTELSTKAMQALSGDLVVLGAGGKMGPSLLRLARRSADAAGRTSQRIVAVARFSEPGLREALARERIETLAIDLLDESARRQLPAAPHALFMLGYKFSTGAAPGVYWGMNVYLPGLLAEQYRQSQVVAFSSGNVYPFVPAGQPAPTESTPCAPVGEYAITAWGRERILEFMSARHGTPMCLLRLNYAVDLRYGVIIDIAQQLLAGEPVSLAVPYVNYCWQGWANAVALAAFGQTRSPAEILNVTGTGPHRVRDLAQGLAERLGVTPRYGEPEGDSALVNNAARCHQLFGLPDVSDEELLDLAAAWLKGGGRTLGRPTKFAVRDGKF